MTGAIVACRVCKRICTLRGISIDSSDENEDVLNLIRINREFDPNETDDNNS
jgi:formate hydrogenlyase subunit 6/NADH:ubiquinone oxidoreductase subunit I